MEIMRVSDFIIRVHPVNKQDKIYIELEAKECRLFIRRYGDVYLSGNIKSGSISFYWVEHFLIGNRFRAAHEVRGRH